MKKVFYKVTPHSLSILFLLAFFIFLHTINSEAAATASIIRVATSGNDSSNCGSIGSPCRTINYAVNQAVSGDTILVAEGTYTTPGSCIVGTAVMCVFAKELTILGGFTTSNWSTANPIANPTIIDGQNSNRPVLLDGRTLSYSPTIRVEGFTVQNGFIQGANSGSTFQKSSFGGGLLAETGRFILRDLIFQNNTAQGGNTNELVGGAGTGGGMAIKRAVSGTTLEKITFQNNKAYGGNGIQRGGYAIGGGLFTTESTINGNNLTFENNIATGGNTNGSGVYDGENADAQGAGIGFQLGSNVTFDGVAILNNMATGGNAPNGNAGGAFGAGLFSEDATVSVKNLLVKDNVAMGGVGKNNDIIASLAFGGGIALSHTNSVIEQASVLNNTAQGGNGNVYAGSGSGGGIYVERFSGVYSTSLTNVIVADNVANMGSGNPQAGGGGGGLFLNSSNATLTHVTFAQNSLGSSLMQGNGLVLISGSNATMHHSILVNHTNPGGVNAIHAQPGNTLTFNNNLLSGNISNIGGSGVFNGGGSNFSGSPDFASPGSPNYDYHIKSDSAAIDKAAGSTTTMDIDNQSRLEFNSPDVGADEFAPIILTAVSKDTELLLTWNVDTNLLSGLDHYQILVTPSSGANNPDQGTSINANLQTNYTLTGLTNHKNYMVVIEARTTGNSKLAKSNTISIFPTDIHTYLPIILK